jgi:hypothetical protein
MFPNSSANSLLNSYIFSSANVSASSGELNNPNGSENISSLSFLKQTDNKYQ